MKKIELRLSISSATLYEQVLASRWEVRNCRS